MRRDKGRGGGWAGALCLSSSCRKYRDLHQDRHKAQYISLKPDPFPQGTRKGYPYHGRWDRIAGAFVHGRGTLYGYPGAGPGMGNSALSEMYWAQGPLIRIPTSPCPYALRKTEF